MKTFISYDLGTGGVKASLFDEKLNTLAKSFIEYGTFYPQQNYHEQAPAEWWNGVVKSTKVLLEKTQMDSKEIRCLALSGHSLVTVPLDAQGRELLERVPIWSDTRAEKQAKDFFEKYNEETWYMKTGNGFPKACYSLFKLMWLKENLPDIYEKTEKVLGSKDYINYRLTGNMYMDYSYASGTGAYCLIEKKMSADILHVSGISESIFPEIVPSDFIVGKILPEAAEEIGLSTETLVACGGVDNACMALGSVANIEGKVYTSLGSSSWIAVNTKKPILDFRKKPYVFAHIDDNMYTSAFSIFAGGSSLRWVRDNVCRDLMESEDAYNEMTKEILDVPPGSGGIIFNPSLAGGTSQDKSVNIKGAFVGLSLGSGRAQMIRAAMEGIAMNLKMSLDNLKEQTALTERIQFCGGGAKNQVWMQMFADIFEKNIVKTNIDQDAASIGAAAIAAKAVGCIEDYSYIAGVHRLEFECIPQKENVLKYRRIQKVFAHICEILSDLGDYMKENLL
ncbi:MAG: FGGY family carbohydrate kinase [Eubacteriales bacterium]|nr:FGGY family carbohydrate kinase [Eubacteriales bacterium]